MTAIDVTQRQALAQRLDQFQQLTADERLGLLWIVYRRMDPAVLRAAATALLSQMVQGVFVQVQQLSRTDQIEALRDIVAGEPTRISQAYANLNANMRLALWYRLAQAMAKGKISRPEITPHCSSISEALVDEISHKGFNEQIFFLRQVINRIGQTTSQRVQ
ncbi:MAG: orange carotenoid protein N-terminal domain-containing protein [Cyanobacteria bacterium J06635_15]